MSRKHSTDPVFDQVSVHLSYASHYNHFLKNTNFQWTFDVLLPLLSRISLIKFLKIIVPKAEQNSSKNIIQLVILGKLQAECLNFY